MMKTKISKRTKRIAVIYLAILILLYVVIYVIPKVTDLFETTQVLENGTLVISCDTEGYFVKDETINVAKKTGKIKYLVNEGTAIKNGTVIAKYEEESDEDEDISGKYAKLLENLEGYHGLKKGMKAKISGVLSFSMDGNEKYFAIKNLDKITKEGVDGLSYGITDLKRDYVVKGEPVFKVSSDDNWYIICWLDKKNSKIFEEGVEVDIELPDGKVPAVVHSVQKDKNSGDYKVVLFSNAYYKTFASTRKATMTIVKSNNTGLIIDNECIIEVDGVTGVYVVDKNGDYHFKPVNITATDGKQSVLSEKTFTNDKFELVETVVVHDEVLRDPEMALKKEGKE